MNSFETKNKFKMQIFFPHPYPEQSNFTGRKNERIMLTSWLNSDVSNSHLGKNATIPILCLTARGGMGKSALAWHWLTKDVSHHGLVC